MGDRTFLQAVWDAITGLKADNLITWVIVAYLLAMIGLAVHVWLWGMRDDAERQAQKHSKRN